MSSGVQFDEDAFSAASKSAQARAGSNSAQQSKMVQWMMAHGIAKSPAMANGILVAAIAVNLIITFVVITYLIF